MLLKITYEYWVFATNSNFLIPIFLQPDGINLWYFKFRLLDLTEFIFEISMRSTTLDCKEIGIIRKSEFMTTSSPPQKKRFYRVAKLEFNRPTESILYTRVRVQRRLCGNCIFPFIQDSLQGCNYKLLLFCPIMKRS